MKVKVIFIEILVSEGFGACISDFERFSINFVPFFCSTDHPPQPLEVSKQIRNKSGVMRIIPLFLCTTKTFNILCGDLEAKCSPGIV